MKTRKLIGWVGAVGIVVLVLVTIVILDQRPKKQPSGSTPVPPPASAGKVASVAPAPEQPSATSPAAVPEAAKPRKVVSQYGDESVPKQVRVKPDSVLATVNGKAIQLKDLIALPKEKAGTEQVMSGERYRFLLNRAVDRELTFQTARGLGVELTEDQQQRLAEHQASSEKREEGQFDFVQQDKESAEFLARDMTAMVLQESLAEKAGVPSQHVTPAQVEAYYKEHQSEYGQLPADPEQQQAAWEKIDLEIRLKLAKELEIEHMRKFKQFVENLKASAKITVASPGE